MALKNDIPQSSRKANRSTSRGSTIAKVVSGKVVPRSMAKANSVIPIEQPGMIVPSSHVKFKISTLECLMELTKQLLIL